MSSSTKNSCLRSCSEKITCRQVLNLMVLLGFMVNYMLRVNLTIAIVAMVAPSNNSADDSAQYNSTNHTNTTGSAATPESSGRNSLDRCVEGSSESQRSLSMRRQRKSPDCGRNARLLASPNHYPRYSFLKSGTRYDWDAYLQNIILGCFFWGYICTELPGGRLAEIFGARRIFGYSTMCASILTLITPLACNISYIAVIILRVILGFMLGATWPAIPPICSKWIPPLERSKFMSNMMASSLGAALTMPMCGFLISSVGWESVFYVTGFIGLLWSIIWFLTIFDTPAEHPRISPEERSYIEDSIGSTTNSGKPLRVPWKKILTSLPVWAIIITHGCSVFGYFTVVNQLPTFTKYILHYNIKANGLLSSLPYLGKYIFAVMTSYLADFLRQSKKLTTTATRKIFTSFAVITPGLLMVFQVYQGYDKVASIAIFTLALTINGAVTAGYLSNGLDIAPNFSGTIFGLANTLSSLGGFLSTLMVGTLTQDQQTYGQWQIVFWILSGTYIFGGLMFLFFGTGELQAWNSPNHSDTAEKNFGDRGEHIPLKNGSSTDNV